MENDRATKAALATPVKMDLATEIHNRMRTVEDITEKLVFEVSLTKGRVSTYYQPFEDKHEP